MKTASALLVFGVAGFIVSALWTFLLGIGGAPGAIIGRLLVPDEDWHGRKVSWLGLLVCVLGQCYVAFSFAVIAIACARGVLARQPDVTGWPIWILAFALSLHPPLTATRDAASKISKGTQDVATPFTLTLTAVAFFVFVVFPQATIPWGWMPLVNDFLAAAEN